MSVGPKPTREDVECLRSDYGASILDQPTTVSRRRLEDVITTVPESSALDLIQHFLHLNPNKRLTAAQALEHPYVAQFRDPSGEIEMDHVVIPPLNDSVKLDISEYRSRLYEMINETRVSKTWTKDCSSSESESASKDGSVVGLTSVTSTIPVEDSGSTTNGTDISTSNGTVSTSSNTSSRSTTPTSTSTLARSHSQARSSSQQRTVRSSPIRSIPTEKNSHSSPFRPQRVFYGNETKKSGKFAVSAEIGVRNRQVRHDFSTNNANAPRRTLGYEDSNDRRTKQVAAISAKPVPYSRSMNTFSKTYDIPMVLRGSDDQNRNEYNKKPPVRHKSVNPGISKGPQVGTWAGPRRGVQWKVRNRSVSPVRSRIPQSQSPQYYQHVLGTSTVPKQTRGHRALVARPWIA
ncbi:unnamed protein product [Hymenolepis diminuta]|uniref:Protein kinase domain-containing protein n=1 Tax=Hymenolepis diminuta TaxID=6216 RepID=A0A564YA14_HYMDI|nr:unnamed protein product [Hymenolepis diminuta]